MRHWIIALLLSLPCSALLAEESVEPLLPQTSEGIRYMTGGIGDEELAQIDAAKTDYNVKLVLAEKTGTYISSVKLTLSNILGDTLVDIASAGPLVLLQLPTGTYQINATYEGKLLQKRIDCRANRAQTVVFGW